ncbi:hypothetical protein F383_05189 [Gossypium arboreum]|nr:hypothetical protein F383_05189 [Gossypium arboreum]
MKRGIQI